MGDNPTYEELKLLNKKNEQKVLDLTESNDRLRSLVDMLPQIIVELDVKGNLIFANQKAFESTGYTKEDFDKGINVLQLIVPEEHTKARRNLQKVFNGEKLLSAEYTIVRKDGSTYPVCVYSSRKIENGRTSGIRAIIIDVTERKEADEELRKASLTDFLTGLANRRNILQRLEHEKNLYERQGHVFSIILCDIDHFKKVNDTYGHDFGDLVLKSISGTFPEILRKIDIASRWGGEEFLILLPACDQDGSRYAAERLRQTIEKLKIQSDHFFVRVTMSFGVVTWKNTFNDIEAFIKQADENLYHAKEEGRNRVIAS